MLRFESPPPYVLEVYMLTYFSELFVPCLDDVDNPRVCVEDDQRGNVEGAHGGVDDVALVLIIATLLEVFAVPIRVRPGEKYVYVSETDLMFGYGFCALVALRAQPARSPAGVWH